MKVFFSKTYDEKVGKQVYLVDIFTSHLDSILQNKYYGDGVQQIYFTFGCNSTKKGFSTGTVVGFDYYKKTSTLEVEVKINHKELIQANEENFHFIGIQALNSIFDYMLLHPIKKFDTISFINDFIKQLQSINFLEKRDLKTKDTPMFGVKNPPVFGITSFEVKETKTFTENQRHKFEIFLENERSKKKYLDKLKKFEVRFKIQKDEKIQIDSYLQNFISFCLENLKTNVGFPTLKEILSDYIDETDLVELDTVCREITDDIMWDYVNMIDV
jgi:hypothetical protein